MTHCLRNDQTCHINGLSLHPRVQNIFSLQINHYTTLDEKSNIILIQNLKSTETTA